MLPPARVKGFHYGDDGPSSLPAGDDVNRMASTNRDCRDATDVDHPSDLICCTITSVNMKSVTYLLTPVAGHYGRVGRFFKDEGIWVVAVHQVDGLSDDTVVIQFEVAESPARLRRILAEDREWICDFQIAPGEDHPTLQLHFEPGGVHRDVIELHRAYAVVFDYPIEIVDHATQTFRVTEVGREDELRALLRETRETIDVTIERIGDYEPVGNSVLDQLTGRQKEVLGTAVELGYYDEPRNVTYEDIATSLECSASAVGQNLRRAERTVMASVVTSLERADGATQA